MPVRLGKGKYVPISRLFSLYSRQHARRSLGGVLMFRLLLCAEWLPLCVVRGYNRKSAMQFWEIGLMPVESRRGQRFPLHIEQSSPLGVTLFQLLHVQL